MIKLEKGFTIIELVVVIAVIGVIILLTEPRFLDKVYESKLLINLSKKIVI